MSFVQERERRANAGSRMRALLDQEEEMEELFEYKEDDEEDDEYSAQLNEEEEDKLDSDFDLNSSEGEQEHAEEGKALDKELEKEEKRARRTAFNPPPSAIASAPKKPAERRKRKKVDIVGTTEDGDYITRHSSRKNTMLNRILVEDQIREQNKRKALQVKRDRPIEKKLTQEELLAEAAITEEQNKDSLLEWQQKEAERKENAKKKDKKGITGPFVRYHSFLDGSYDEATKSIMLSERQDAEGDTEMEETENAIEEKTVGEEEQVVGKDDNLDDSSVDKMGRNLITFVESEACPYEGILESGETVTTDKDLDLVDLVNQLSSWLEKSPKPNKPILCPITGEPAKYRDPKTNVPYANIRAYNIIKSCFHHEMNWSPSVGLYLGNLPSADGVPKEWNSMMN